jgi:hypothetical protein
MREKQLSCDSWGGDCSINSASASPTFQHNVSKLMLPGKLFFLILMENSEHGDELIETVYDVQENEIKYAAARLVELASAKGITCYSVEVAENGSNPNAL